MVDDMRFNYSDLNPDLIMDAIDLSGLRIDSGLIELNSYENRVYQFQDEDRRRYVVKFYRPGRWSRAQILEEHEFAARLMETEIPVAAPSASPARPCWSIRATLRHLAERRWPSVRGGQPGSAGVGGRYLGRIHRVGASHGFHHRVPWTWRPCCTSRASCWRQANGCRAAWPSPSSGCSTS